MSEDHIVHDGEMIPGERDPSTLTHREPGAIGSFSGAELPPQPPPWLDEERIKELREEGGGRVD